MTKPRLPTPTSPPPGFSLRPVTAPSGLSKVIEARQRHRRNALIASSPAATASCRACRAGEKRCSSARSRQAMVCPSSASSSRRTKQSDIHRHGQSAETPARGRTQIPSSSAADLANMLLADEITARRPKSSRPCCRRCRNAKPPSGNRTFGSADRRSSCWQAKRSSRRARTAARGPARSSCLWTVSIPGPRGGARSPQTAPRHGTPKVNKIIGRQKNHRAAGKPFGESRGAIRVPLAIDIGRADAPGTSPGRSDFVRHWLSWGPARGRGSK